MLNLNDFEPGDLEAALNRILEIARERFAADVLTIFTINPVTGWFLGEPAVLGLLSPDNKAALKPRSSGGLTCEVAAGRGPLFVERLSDHPNYQGRFTRAEGIQSFVTLSLRTRAHKKPLAVIYVGFRQERTFSDAEKNALGEFADQASSVLNNTWLLRRYGTVAKIGHDINKELDDVETLFRKLYEQAGDILDTSYFMLAVCKPQTDSVDLHIMENQRLVLVADCSLEGPVGQVIREKHPLVIDDLAAARDLSIGLSDIPRTSEEARSIIIVPLLFHNTPMGALSIQHVEPNAFDSEDRHILELLANQVALALHNMRLFESLSALGATAYRLTQRLGSETVLHDVVEWIRTMSKCDIAVLFSYVEANKQFVTPPVISGGLQAPHHPQPDFTRPDHIVSLALYQQAPVYARDSSALYTNMNGDPTARRGSFESREKVRSTAMVPLRVNEETVGILFVNFRQKQRFDAPQKHLIQGLANYAAMAIKNSREFGAQAARHVKELELLRKIDAQISKTLNLGEVLQTILELAVERVPADEAAILLKNPRTFELETKAGIGRNVESSLRRSVSLRQDGGIPSWVYRNRAPARVDDVRGEDWRSIYLEATGDTRSELDVPLVDGVEVIGVISFESTKEAAYSQEDQNFLVALADRAVLAIKNAQIYEHAQRIATELIAMREVGREIVSQLNVKAVLETILDNALAITNSMSGQIMLVDRERNEVYAAAERGTLKERKRDRHPIDEGPSGWVIQHRRSLNRAVGEPPWAEVYEEVIPNIKWELAVPLIEKGEARGVINIESSRDQSFTYQDEFLLKELADLAVIALQNAERYEKAEEGKNRLQALHEIDKAIIAQLDDPDKVMEAILQHALSLTKADRCQLFVQSGSERAVYSIQGDGLTNSLVLSQSEANTDIEDGIVNHVITSLVPYRTRGDAQDDPHYRGEAKIRSQAAIPLSSRTGKLFGVLNLTSHEADAFDDDDLWVLALFAGEAVIAINTARAYQKAADESSRAKAESSRFQLLEEAGRRLGQITRLDQIQMAYEHLVVVFKRHNEGQVLIRRYNEEAQSLTLVMAGVESQQIPSVLNTGEGGGINERVFRERRTVVVPNVDNSPTGVTPILLTGTRIGSLVVTPIQFEKTFYGTIAVSHEDVNYFQDADVTLIDGLARQLAVTIHRLETAKSQQEAEQRAREAEVMGSLGLVASIVLHRLTNSLGPAKENINRIKEELAGLNVSSEVSARLDLLVKSVDQTLGIGRILRDDVARIDVSGSPTRDLQIVVVQELLEMALRGLPELHKNIRIERNIAPDTATIRVVPWQIADVLHSLMMNAAEAMPSGGRIAIDARNAGPNVEIRVSDTGPGIPKDQQAKIFSPFYSTKKAGAGMGLWSAVRSALANGGELSLQSEPGLGAEFKLLIPKAHSGQLER